MPLITSQQSRLLGRRATAAASNGLLTALVAYWGLDEAGGANNALDKHSNGLTLTQQDSPGSAAGLVYAGARTFDGSADYFTRNSETLLVTGDVDFTYAAWIYSTNVANQKQPIMGRWDDAVAYETLLYIAAGTNYPTFTVYKTGSGYGIAAWGSSIVQDTWNLIVGWHDAANDVVGIQVVGKGTAITQPWANGANTTMLPFKVARSYETNNFTGRIGPCMFWKSAAGGGGVLSAAKLTALYNAGAGLTYAAFTA